MNSDYVIINKKKIKLNQGKEKKRIFNFKVVFIFPDTL